MAQRPGAAGGVAGAELRAAWNELIAQLEAGRDAIDDPKLYPPPPTERNVAEGYRYLLGFLYGAIGRALHDPMFPTWRRAIEPTDKATIDNADAVYLYAPIDGNESYVVRARAGDTRHWRGEPAIASGRKAPQYIIFETPSGYAGDSGSITELRPGSRANGGVLDSAKLQLEPDGRFEVLLAPTRPPGHTGNYIPTKATRNVRKPDGSSELQEYVSRWVTLRELFHDWEHEDLLDLEIMRLGSEGEHPAALDPARAAAQMKRTGEIVNNQMRFWNEFYAVTLETYGIMHEGKPPQAARSEPQASEGGPPQRQQFMPRNDMNAANAASLATGGGQATNVYSGGVYDLRPDEALLIENAVPVVPQYSGFHLSNLWGESLDFANHQSSLNWFQAEPDADGVRRYVIAHRDPGVPNWVDTTGLPQGFLTFRWAYSELPAKLPTVKVTKIPHADIRKHLPPGTRSVSDAERREAVAIRQRHVQRRYRQY